jgi:hypothetical protein
VLIVAQDNNYADVAAISESAHRLRELTDRLAQNLSDFHNYLLTLDQQEIIDDACMIAAMSDAQYYLMEYHTFKESEVDFLLQFQNPLEVVADKWYERICNLDDFPFALDAVFESQEDALKRYELFEAPQPPAAPVAGMADINIASDVRANTKAVKPSIKDQLREAAEKAAAHNAQTGPKKNTYREGEAL